MHVGSQQATKDKIQVLKRPKCGRREDTATNPRRKGFVADPAPAYPLKRTNAAASLATTDRESHPAISIALPLSYCTRDSRTIEYAKFVLATKIFASPQRALHHFHCRVRSNRFHAE